MRKVNLPKNEKMCDVIGLSAGAIAKEDTSDSYKGILHVL
jgi:hypothetical protein